MKNAAIKRQAVELIRRAVADGWTRTVEKLVIGSSRLSVTVFLEKTIKYANGYTKEGGMILVSFRFGYRGRHFRGRDSVSIRTRAHYEATFKAGLRNANYVLKQVREGGAK